MVKIQLQESAKVASLAVINQIGHNRHVLKQAVVQDWVHGWYDEVKDFSENLALGLPKNLLVVMDSFNSCFTTYANY